MTRPRVTFVVNGRRDSAMAERAESFADRLAGRFAIHILYREGGAARTVPRILRSLVRIRPDVCYVFDLAAAGIAAAGLYKHLAGTPFVVDTGDAVVDLGRVLGRGPAGMLATRSLETYALRAAAAIVVRGSNHRDLLRRRGVRAVFIPDGVAVDRFHFSDPVHSHSPDKLLTIGLVGSSVWIPSRQTCYGMELVELVRLLVGRVEVRGVLIGDGSGIDVLRKRAAEIGVADRIEFAGRVPYADLPGRLQQLNVCLSTQTDDMIGRVRTTGKLPLYLAAGRFVLASKVGEAARVLPAEMLVEFHGSVDPMYPARLADRIVQLVARGISFGHRPACVEIAREHFEYDRLARRVATVLDRVLWHR